MWGWFVLTFFIGILLGIFGFWSFHYTDCELREKPKFSAKKKKKVESVKVESEPEPELSEEEKAKEQEEIKEKELDEKAEIEVTVLVRNKIRKKSDGCLKCQKFKKNEWGSYDKSLPKKFQGDLCIEHDKEWDELFDEKWKKWKEEGKIE
jgi:hypothetical protein